ncbi:MAG: ABC transporter permease [Patescibacteria group bacterium]
MKYSHSLNIAIKALKTNKVRTILTVLGMLIGITAVSVIISTGDSVQNLVYKQVASFGSDYVQIETRVPKSGGGTFSQAQGVVISTMKLGDKEAIDKLPNIRTSYASSFAQEILSWNGNIKKSTIFATGPEFIDIDTAETAKGRFYTKEEDDSLARVIVLGSNVKDKLFGNSEAVGENVKINNMNFKVIGVMAPRGTIFFFNFDDIAYIPIQTTQKLLLGVDYISSITAQMRDPKQDKETVAAAQAILRDRHDISDPSKDDFEVTTAADAQDMLGTILGGVTLLLVALAGISLIVGGVGIMNIMYATVSERTFEIGLRKALGASKKDILQQFLAEAVVITLLGGAIGIVFSWLLTYLIFVTANYYNLDWAFKISVFGIFLSLGFSVAIGLIFGLYPAKRAADLDPIEALRK